MNPSETSLDPLGRLLAWAGALRAGDLPDEALGSARDSLLNTVAAMLSGSAAPGALEIVAQLREWGGRPEAVVVAHGLRLPAPMAAMANGVMAHAMDFDDTQAGTGLHASVSLVPALLAAAALRPDAGGGELLAAQVAGLEAACRLTLTATRRSSHPWLTTTLFGIFGATIAAGRLLRLDAAQLRHAVGIAYGSAGGTRQGLLDGTLIQRVQPGLCAQAAVAAVLYAKRGVSGAVDVLQGRYGLYPNYYGEDHDIGTLTAGLGQVFHMTGIALKAYPCCSYSQEPIEAALELAASHDLRVSSIESVTAWVVSDHAAGLIGRPYAPRDHAQVDAQFSIQYVIAAAFARRSLGLADFQEQALHDPAVMALAPRVRVAVDPEREGTLDVQLKDGTRLTRRILKVKGHPDRRFGRDELVARLRESSDFAHAPRTEGQLSAIVQCIDELAGAPSAAALPMLLA